MVRRILSYEEYTDFKNYVRDILDARYTNVAAENEVVGDERKNYSRTIKLTSLEEKINPLSKEKWTSRRRNRTLSKVTETSNTPEWKLDGGVGVLVLVIEWPGNFSDV